MLKKKNKEEVVDKRDLIGFSMSNLEYFYFVKNRKNYYRKIYFSFKYNDFKENKDVDQKFKEVMISGTSNDYKNVDLFEDK